MKLTPFRVSVVHIGKHETYNPDDDYMGSGVLIRQAEEQEGLENFTKTILFDFDKEHDMLVKERELVNEDFVARDDTYNLTIGGAGGFSYINENRDKINLCGFAWFNKYATEEQKLLCAEKRALEVANRTPERKMEISRAISSGLKTYYKLNGHHWKGRHHTESSKSMIGLKNSVHQKGCGNSNYGKHWWTNPQTGESHPFFDSDVPDGWVRGRSCKRIS